MELTKEEEKAIRAIRKLAKNWPQTLLIFGSGGTSLSIRKPDSNGRYGYSSEVACIEGIRNDGGDGGDEL